MKYCSVRTKRDADDGLGAFLGAPARSLCCHGGVIKRNASRLRFESVLLI